MFLFKEEHVPMIVAGTKTQTRRMHTRPRAIIGSHHWAQRGMTKGTRFAKIEFTRTPWTERLGDITEADALAEGYGSLDDYFTAFMLINAKKDASLDTRVWCYEFKLVDVTPLGHAITARLYAKGAIE